MDRSDLLPIIDSNFEDIKSLFTIKNASYGSDNDLFHNFRNTALRVNKDNGYESMFKVLLTYMDKHLVALANKGIDEREFESRFQDVIVYSLIAIAMKRESDKEKDDKGTVF